MSIYSINVCVCHYAKRAGHLINQRYWNSHTCFVILLAVAATVPNISGFRGYFQGEEIHSYLYPLLAEPAESLPQLLISNMEAYRNLRFLTDILWFLNVKAFGLWFPVYFAINLLLHLSWVLLVYWILVEVTEQRQVAFLAALVTALHPIHISLLQVLTTRNDSLCGCLMLLGILAWLRAVRQFEPRFLIHVIICFVLALFSKEMALSFPLLGLLLVASARSTQPHSWKCLLRNPLIWKPFTVLIGLNSLYVFIRIFTFNGLGGYGIHGRLDERILSVFSLHLKGLMGMPTTDTFFTTIILVIMITGILWKIPVARRGWVWIGLSLLPVYNIAAPWYLYIPSLGLGWSLAETVSYLYNSTKYKMAVWMAGIVTVLVAMNLTYSHLSVKTPEARYFSELAGQLSELTHSAHTCFRIERERPKESDVLSVDFTQDFVRTYYRSKTLFVRTVPKKPSRRVVFVKRRVKRMEFLLCHHLCVNK